jgi:hypothetical protein
MPNSTHFLFIFKMPNSINLMYHLNEQQIKHTLLMKKNYLLFILLLLPFYVSSQNLVSISPSSGIAGRQDASITIIASGTHFTQSEIIINFAFSPGFLNSITTVNDTTLVANVTIPVNTPTGDYDVDIYDSIDGTLKTSFHVTSRPLPLVTSINPNTANAGQTLNVTVAAKNARFNNNSTLVFFRTIPLETVVNSINVLNDTVLEASITVPANTFTGNYSCILFTMDDGAIIDTAGFHVQGVTPPTLTSISPSSGKPGQTLTVNIQGDHTHFTPNKTVVSFDFKQGDPLIADSVKVISQTLLQARLTIPDTTVPGDYIAYVTIVETDSTGTNQIGNGSIPFKVKTWLPSITSITPSSETAGRQYLDVIIKGENTHFMDTTGTYVDFAFNPGLFLNFFSPINDTILEGRVSIPVNIPTGDYVVTIYNSFDTLKTSFHVTGRPQPKVISITPSSVNTGETLDITVKVRNVRFLKDSTWVRFQATPGRILTNSVTVINDTTLIVNITTSSWIYTGNSDLVFETWFDGVFTETGGLHVQGMVPPSLTSISPSIANAGERLTVAIKGARTHFIPGKTSVGFDFKQAGQTLADVVNVLSDTTLEATLTIPSKTLSGSYNTLVSVILDDSISGEVQLDQNISFNVKAKQPVIDSVSPWLVWANQTLNIAIHGTHTHFIQNKTFVHFGFDSTGTVVNFVQVINDTVLNANVTIPVNTRRAYYAVTVTDSIDGTFSKENCLRVEEAVRIRPAEGYTSQTMDVMIYGIYSPTNPSDLEIRFIPHDTTVSELIVNSITIIDTSSARINITIPPNQPAGNYRLFLRISDGGGIYDNVFQVKNCPVRFTTSYDLPSNTFTLKLDSVTTHASKFNWDFGDGTSSTDKLPSHSFTKDTLYNVCLTATTAAGVSCTYCHVIGKDSLGNPVLKNMKGFTMTVVPYKDVITNTDELPDANPLVILYPNPASTMLTIEASNMEDSNIKLSISDVLGKCLMSEQMTPKDHALKKQINIEGVLSKGVYFVTVENERGRITNKLIIQ